MANFGYTGERAIDSPSLRVEVRPLFRLVYLWMGFGLLLTTFVSILTARTPALQNLLIENPLLIFVAFIALSVFALVLGAGIQRFSVNTAVIFFVLFSGLMGFVLSLFFLFYPIGSIVTAFITTTALFGVMSVIGYTTQVDLAKYRTYFMMGLIGLVIAMVVNMFMMSGPFDLLISMVGVVLFTALTAYDTQKIKQLAADPNIQADNNLTVKMALLGALILYLDFINLFLFLLFLGGGRD